MVALWRGEGNLPFLEWGYEGHCNLQRQDGQILAYVLMTSVCSIFWLVPFLLILFCKYILCVLKFVRPTQI